MIIISTDKLYNNSKIGHRFSFVVIMFIAFFLCNAQAGHQYTGKELAKALISHEAELSRPKQFVVRKGQDFIDNKIKLKKIMLDCTGLNPLPEKVPLNVYESSEYKHPWCSIKKVYYQLFEGVYADGLLFVPKTQKSKYPAVLAPHGHWENSYANPDHVQPRCLHLAKMGYVVFATGAQAHHYEDLAIGLSNQTHMIWSNIRALDYLQSLEIVDCSLGFGCCGASGGGMQTLMLCALDERISVVTIVGMSCQFEDVLFPYIAHCDCIHFPDIMRYTDFPEIISLAFDSAVEHITLNDWTVNFLYDSFPQLQTLYEMHNIPKKTECVYFPLPHGYGKYQRERTYWWMEKWLKNDKKAILSPEDSDINIIEPEKLRNLPVDMPGGYSGVSALSKIWRDNYGYTDPEINQKEDWLSWHVQFVASVKNILGIEYRLKSKTKFEIMSEKLIQGVTVKQLNIPSEGSVFLPTVTAQHGFGKPKHLMIFLNKEGSRYLFDNVESFKKYLSDEIILAMPDVRFFGNLSIAHLAEYINLNDMPYDEKVSKVTRAWDRNSILWGRPLSGMTAIDIKNVIGFLSEYYKVQFKSVRIIADFDSENRHDSINTALGTLFAAAFDSRITEVEVDLGNFTFKNGREIVLPNILKYGDVQQILYLLANKNLTVHNLNGNLDKTKVCEIFKVINGQVVFK